MMKRAALILTSIALLSGCGPDRAAFLQKDPRWGSEQLGKSSDTMASDGCLVTATSMALANLGFQTTPSDLNDYQ